MSDTDNLVARLEAHAVRYSNDYGYDIATDLSKAANMLRDAGARTDIAKDSSFLAGLKAGWNFGASDDQKGFSAMCQTIATTNAEARIKARADGLTK